MADYRRERGSNEMAKRGSTSAASAAVKHQQLGESPRKYKHIWRLCCTQADFDDVTQTFMNKARTLMYPQKLLPVPLHLKADNTIAQWQRENYGTTAASIAVSVYDTTIMFESAAAQLLALTAQLSERLGYHEMLYKYASDNLLDVGSMGNLNYSNGRLLNKNEIQSPQAFACSLWGRDLFDLCCKRSLYSNALYVDEVDVCEDTDVEDWVLAQED